MKPHELYKLTEQYDIIDSSKHTTYKNKTHNLQKHLCDMVGGTIQVKCQKQAQSYKDKQNSIDLKAVLGM